PPAARRPPPAATAAHFFPRRFNRPAVWARRLPSMAVAGAAEGHSSGSSPRRIPDANRRNEWGLRWSFPFRARWHHARRHASFAAIQRGESVVRRGERESTLPVLHRHRSPGGGDPVGLGTTTETFLVQPE